MTKISIIIPVFNEAAVLDLLFNRLDQTLSQLDKIEVEYLFVNDGSTDQTAAILEEKSQHKPELRYIELSRNFGKEAALLAGLDHAQADAVVLMDADLQHPPEKIIEMISWWQKGYEDVFAVRRQSKHKNGLKRLFSKLYYGLLKKMTAVDVYPAAGDFRLLDRKAVEALKRMRERSRNMKGMYAWIGFKKKEISYEEDERAAGRSKWSFSKLLTLALDGMTATTTAPLRLWSVIGMVISIIAFIFLILELAKALIFGSEVAGYPTLLACIVFLGGVQLISLGAIGEYLARVFVETKDRPVYFIRRTSDDPPANRKE